MVRPETVKLQNKILRIVLRSEGKLAHLEQPLIPPPYPVASQAARDAFEALYDAQKRWHVLCLVIAGEERAKGKGKGKKKLAYVPKAKIISPPKRDNLEKDYICHHCKEVGHWRRNFSSYHAELKKRKNASMASTSGIFTIKLYAYPNKTWVYDKSCGTHICNTSQGPKESRKLKHRALSLYMGNGMHATVEAIRSFDLILPSGLIIVLDSCHFASTITSGVVSISCLVNNGYIYTFTNYGIFVSKDNVFYFNAILRDVIYEIDMHNLYPNGSYMYNVSNKRAKHVLDSYYLWHYRLGHINKKRMDVLLRDGLLQPTHDKSHEKFKSFISMKMVWKPFPHQVKRAKDLLGLIHTDVCGPFRTVSREGASYFITFIDDFSRYGFVYMMKHKREVFETFNVFQNEVENQLGKKIKAIRSDRGGEYLSHEFVNHMKSCSIVSQLTSPYTPQHNGVSKRRNQTLLDMVRSMMNLTTLPKSFWGYALETAAHILNMVPTKKVDRTPYEIWHGKAPKLSYLRVWGYEALEKRDIPEKLDSRSIKCIFIEASGSHEHLKMSGSDKGLEIIQEEDTQPSNNTSEAYNEVAPIEVCELGDLDEPPHYKAALAYPESDKWLEAMNTKIQSMKDNQVWYLVDLPSNGRTIGCKWLFKKKTNMDGNVHTFKARLMAKGFTQTYGVDYKETLSPVADIRAIRILLTIAVFYDYKIWQMDVKTAFPNGYLSEDVYMVQLEGFVDQKHPTKSKRLIALSQSTYLEKILKKYIMENSKKGYTLMMEKLDYRKSQGAKTPTEVQRMQRVPYGLAVGSIMSDDTKSQTGYVFILNGGAVDWKNAKQSTAAMFSTEAEYIVVVEASMEAVWMRKFIDGLRDVMPSNKIPMDMLCDNEPALAIASDVNLVEPGHFQRKYHYIREVIQEGEIVLKKVHTYDNVDDLFTKPMPFNKHLEHAMAIKIVPASSLIIPSLNVPNIQSSSVVSVAQNLSTMHPWAGSEEGLSPNCAIHSTKSQSEERDNELNSNLKSYVQTFQVNGLNDHLLQRILVDGFKICMSSHWWCDDVGRPQGYLDNDFQQVDDIIFGSTTHRYTQLFADLMKCRFEMSMMGEMKFFLGLQVNKSPRGIFINQSNYVLDILKKYGMETCDPIGTPMEIKDKLELDQNGTLVDARKYRSMIGILMYLTSSRTDIVHVTCLCARYQAKPTEKHLKEVKRIFRYLRGTVNMGL
ncbi:retrotransposon protein, putative, ty1-copia subclass [Tanacetum coccineum]